MAASLPDMTLDKVYNLRCTEHTRGLIHLSFIHQNRFSLVELVRELLRISQKYQIE